MKLLLFTTIVAFASALPSTAPDALPSSALPSSALPSTAPDAVVPEMNLAQADSPAKAAKTTIQAMLASGSDDSACADLAQTTLDEVTDSVAERQGMLNDLDTGADCPNTMAGEVSAAETALSDAETARTEADSAAATAQSAEVHFDSVPFSSLHEGECATFFDDAGYTSAKATAESTAKAAAEAASTVTAMQTTLETTREAQTKAIKDCQCHAYAEYESAWSAATSHESDDAAAWQKGKHMQCVLEGTDPATCDVGTVPTVSPITLAPGVTGEGCPEGEEEEEEEAHGGILGELGQVACPSGYERVYSEDTCKVLIKTITGKDAASVGKSCWNAHPKGCFTHFGRNGSTRILVNNDGCGKSSGTTYSDSQSICKKMA